MKKWEERLYGALAGLLALADFPEEVEEMSESAFEEIAVIRKEIADVPRTEPLSRKSPARRGMSCGSARSGTGFP